MSGAAKTYYTMKNKGGACVGSSYLSGVGLDGAFRFGAKQADSLKFYTLGSLIDAIEKRARNGIFTALKTQLGAIVKITETPGTGETRRELKELEQAKPGEAVKYAIYGTEGGAWRRNTWGAFLSDAALYDTQVAAIDAVQDAVKGGYGIGPTEIRRVAVKPNGPVITETVLA